MKKYELVFKESSLFDCYNSTEIINRHCSKVNKSTKVIMAVNFAHFRFSVISFCVIATIKNEFATNTSSHILIVAKTKKTITLNRK
jgi:hypothetical protein